METSSIVIIVILLIALFFMGITLINSNNANVGSTGSYPSQSQYVGGGCGR